MSRPRCPTGYPSHGHGRIGLVLGACLIIAAVFVAGWLLGARNRPAPARPTKAAARTMPTDRVDGPAERAPRPAPAPPSQARSPIPEPGESIARPFAPQRIAPPAPPAPLSADAIPWTEAHEHVGQSITVQGRIVATRNTGTVCFLNFAKDWRDKFYIILFEEVLGSWPGPPQDFFLNRNVLVSGEVTMHRGRPQIRVRDQAQIALVDAP